MSSKFVLIPRWRENGETFFLLEIISNQILGIVPQIVTFEVILFVFLRHIFLKASYKVLLVIIKFFWWICAGNGISWVYRSLIQR
jgi:hypothetical protein